jgi:uncharacterized protein (DUF58 family)
VKRISNPTPRPTAFLNRTQISNEGLAWLGLAVLVGLIGWWKSINVVFLLAYFMVCLLVMNGFIARLNVRRVRVTRELQLPIHVGEEAIIQLTVSNIGTSTATVIVDNQIDGKSVRWLVPDLQARTSISCQSRRVFATRGQFLARVRVSSGYPIGLISIDRPAAMSEVTVLPAVGMIDADGLRRWVNRQTGNSDRSRKVLRRVTTDQADVRGVRPYRPGDPIRTIHWRSSARRGELVVREYDTAQAPDLVLVVEPWLPTTPTPCQRDDLEAALSLAATIASNWSRVYGTLVTLVVAGEPGSVHTTTPTDRGVRDVLTPLARVTGNNEFEPLNRDVFNQSLAHAARLVVSSRSNSPYASRIAYTTGRLFVAVSPTDRLPWYQPPREVTGDKRMETGIQPDIRGVSDS